ncbi:MAG: glycosyltransferase family 39 protein [Myxococcales bacterium]|nr:glycosyltransferase family 39 protein [Myxococcales bacterium]
MTEPKPFIAELKAGRHDTALIAVLGLLVLTTLFVPLGVWEPWEADAATITDGMRETGQWLRAQVPQGDGWRVVPDMPYGFWPQLATTSLLGVNEWGLRLPALLMALGVLVMLFAVTRRFFGRTAAWLAALSLLCMPLFTYHGRFALGSGLAMGLIAVSALAFLRVIADDEARPAWGWAAWLALAGAGLTAGVNGFIAPLFAAGVAVATRRAQGANAVGPVLRRVLPPVPVLGALILVGVGWWRAAAVQPDENTLTALLLWPDPIDGVTKGADRPSFDVFVHQLGFGLFPLGALLPFAFADVLWGSDDDRPFAPWLFAGLAAWFAAAFLGPAIANSYSHHALFLGAPAAAVVIGVYFERTLRAPPQPLMALGAVIVLALLDSNLKHDTRLLADTLVGESVDAFPAKLPGWWASRLLSIALLGVLLVYQGGLHRFLARFVREIAYPRVPRPSLDWVMALLTAVVPIGLLFRITTLQGVVSTAWWTPLPVRFRAVVVGVAIWLALWLATWWILAFIADRRGRRRPRWFEPALVVGTALPSVIMLLFTNALAGLIENPWGTLSTNGRKALVAGVAWLAAYMIAVALYNLRWRLLSGRRDGPLAQSIDGLVALADRRELRLDRYALFAVLGLWVAFLNLPVARALTTNFSQKDILERYDGLAQGDEPLLTYRLDDRSASFYARTLPSVARDEFLKRAAEDSRFFAIIPRGQLASINTEFRRKTERTIPVLDDRGSRFLLVSNVLRDGEEDRNPITRALVSELPPTANKVSIKFEDKIELVGWTTDPREPSPGSPMTISLFWKSLSASPGTWKVFVHIDAPGQRIHGDHDPVEGLFPTRDWHEGDLVRDDHQLVVKRTITPATFTVYAGLYRGGDRMKITSGPKDNENRAKLGSLVVR